MDLRKSSSNLNNGINPAAIKRPKTKGFSIGKIIYFTVIGGLVLLALTYLVTRIFYIKASGVYTASSTVIYSESVARIKNVKVKRFEKVEKGDTLVTLIDDDYNSNPNNLAKIQTQSVTVTEKDEQKKINLQKQLKLLRTDEEHQKQQLESSKRQYDKARLLVLQDAINNKELERFKKEFENAGYALELTKEKIHYTILMLKNLGKTTVKLNTGNYGGSSDWFMKNEVLVAPHNGIITEVKHVDYEVVDHDEPILNVVNIDDHYIMAFFKFSKREYINVGNKVRLAFDDDNKYYGYIREVYPASHFLLEEFRAEFSLREKYIAAEIFVVPNTPIKPKAFFDIATELELSATEVFNDIVDAGYIDEDGYLMYYFEPKEDRYLFRLPNKYKPYVNSIYNKLLAINNLANNHILSTSVTVIYSKASTSKIYPIKKEQTKVEN